MSGAALAYAPSRENWDRDFASAIQYYEQGNGKIASTILHRLLEEGSQDPIHQSYCGLLTALVDRAPQNGLKLCREALNLGFLEPQVYLNLAQVQKANRQHDDAVQTLRRGLRAAPENEALLDAINKLSPRKPPALSLLSRQSWINQVFGRLLARMPG